MEMRLTVTVEAPDAVVDATGKVEGIELHPEDRAFATEQGAAQQVLKHIPPAIYLRLDNVQTEFLPPTACEAHAETGACCDCSACDFHRGVIAIQPYTPRQAFRARVTLPAEAVRQGGTGDVEFELKVKRRQSPLTIRTANTLHTLQGTTASPRLIFHWRFPRRMTKEMRWLGTYVALSRPPSFQQLISVGMPKDFRATLEGGPPDGILTKFAEFFFEKEAATAEKLKDILKKVGWA